MFELAWVLRKLGRSRGVNGQRRWSEKDAMCRKRNEYANLSYTPQALMSTQLNPVDKGRHSVTRFYSLIPPFCDHLP